jgi:hypothetical protein
MLKLTAIASSFLGSHRRLRREGAFGLELVKRLRYLLQRPVHKWSRIAVSCSVTGWFMTIVESMDRTALRDCIGGGWPPRVQLAAGEAVVGRHR